MLWKVLFYLVILRNCLFCYGSEKEMTVSVAHGTSECFWETLKTGQILEIEYQVIDGDHGDLDINFHLYTPSGIEIVSDYKKGENSHKVEIHEAGDYKMCWENTISYFNFKTVFFEILIDNHKEDWSNFNQDSVSEKYEMEVAGIMETVSRVHSRLTSIRQMQDIIRAYEARDRNVIESNFELVNQWSMLLILVMFVVGAVQVIMVKSLFDDKSKVHQIWKAPLLSR